VSPVKYEMGFYIPEDDILHSHRRENLKSYIESRLLLLLSWTTSLYTDLPSASVMNVRRYEIPVGEDTPNL
jgi:hypothetical protein